MRISVIGCGYLGAVHAACMAELGHSVVGIDTDAAKVASLSAGRSPFFEPGLDAILERNVANGRLRFSTDYEDAGTARVHFLAVGTPQRGDSHAADMRFIEAASDSLFDVLVDGGSAVEPSLIVGKSTVPVGTAGRLAEKFAAKGLAVAWNPEFLREGFAVKDTLHPDRIVYGVPSDTDEAQIAQRLLDEVYAEPLRAETPKIVTDYATAELVKAAANAFLATKISFINAMAELCDATGADVTTLAAALGEDDRIGKKFLRAGVGFGGGCLPKDIRAFIARAEELGEGDALEFLRDVDELNNRQRDRAIAVLEANLERPLADSTIAVLGAAFKPDSDDIRDSPALDIALKAAEAGATVRITDPEAGDSVRRIRPDQQFVDTVEEAVRHADAVMVLTEWREFRELDPDAVGQLVRGRLVIDGRNCLDPATWRAAGWRYVGMGRR